MGARDPLLLRHELPGTGLLLTQFIPSRRRVAPRLFPQSSGMSLRHTPPHRDDRPRIRFLTAPLLTRPAVRLTLRLRRRTRRLTAQPFRLTLPVSRIPRTPLRHGILAAQLVVQVIEVQTGAFQLTAQTAELIFGQFTIRSRAPQVASQ